MGTAAIKIERTKWHVFKTRKMGLEVGTEAFEIGTDGVFRGVGTKQEV